MFSLQIAVPALAQQPYECANLTIPRLFAIILVSSTFLILIRLQQWPFLADTGQHLFGVSLFTRELLFPANGMCGLLANEST